MKVRLLVFLGLCSLTAQTALAYIPSTRTILNRMAKNVGKGTYQIEQEVQFRTDAEPLVLRERWIVENGDSMRLQVSGAKGSTEGWRLDVVYKDGKRWFPDATGTVKTVAQSNEFIEPYLHFRSGKSVLETLIRQRVLPSNLSNHQKTTKTLNGVTYKHETFVRLARSGGVIAYAFGEPTQPNSTKLNPGLWVDQDSFLFRRLRFPSQAEVEADKHIFAAGGMRIPRDRTVTWDNNSATVRVLSVRAAPAGQAQKMISSSALSSGGKAPIPKLPESAQVREFYQRFR